MMNMHDGRSSKEIYHVVVMNLHGEAGLPFLLIDHIVPQLRTKFHS